MPETCFSSHSSLASSLTCSHQLPKSPSSFSAVESPPRVLAHISFCRALSCMSDCRRLSSDSIAVWSRYACRATADDTQIKACALEPSVTGEVRHHRNRPSENADRVASYVPHPHQCIACLAQHRPFGELRESQCLIGSLLFTGHNQHGLKGSGVSVRPYAVSRSSIEAPERTMRPYQRLSTTLLCFHRARAYAMKA